MNIREIAKSDLKEIALLQERCFDDGWTENMLKESFDKGLLFGLVAEEDEKIISTVTFLTAVDSADLLQIVTEPKFRKRGIAKKLLEEAVTALADKNIKKVFLEVRFDNATAISLYNKSGFKIISVRKKYYADGVDAVIMEREI